MGVLESTDQPRYVEFVTLYPEGTSLSVVLK